MKLIDVSIQTDNMEISETDCTPSPCLASRDISMCLERSPSPIAATTIKLARNVSTKNYRKSQYQSSPSSFTLPQQSQLHPYQSQNETEQELTSEAISSINGNPVMTTSDLTTYHDACSSPDEQLINDAMNSNERLDIRDCSDDDNLERLGRKVSEFFTENRLSLQSDNGNNSIDGGLLFDVMAARRSFISVNENDQVTVISRCPTYSTNGNVKAKNNYNSHKHKIKASNDHNYKVNDDRDDEDDDDGDECCDDSWTDEEGEDPEYSYSLRRKR